MWNNLRSYISHGPSSSIGAAFVMMSLLFGSWITRIPDIKLQLGLSEGALGLALLGMPIGAIIIMPFMGALIHRFGAGKMTWFGSVVYILAMILPAVAIDWASLAGALLLVGIGAGIMDVAMNAAAAAIEKRYQKLIMSTSHAMFSLGGMVGAGVASLLPGLGVSPLIHFTIFSIMLLVVSLILRKRWFALSDDHEGNYQWAWPAKAIGVLAFIGFCVLLSEGAIADWSAVYLRETLGGSSFIGGLGFAGFSFAMALGRFYGDIVVPKWGAAKLVRLGGLFAGTSLGLALLIGSPFFAIIGFTLAGLGLSCVVPIVFSSAASIPGVSPGAGLAAISSMGYIGFMIGPPAIGFIAEELGLTYGIGLVVLLCLFLGALANRAFAN
jgi:MFS family permease